MFSFCVEGTVIHVLSSGKGKVGRETGNQGSFFFFFAIKEMATRSGSTKDDGRNSYGPRTVRVGGGDGSLCSVCARNAVRKYNGCRRVLPSETRFCPPSMSDLQKSDRVRPES